MLELITIALVVIVITAKWLTTFHTQKLATRLVTAENLARRNEKRFRQVHEERKQLIESTKELNLGIGGVETAVQELTGELYEVEQRNAEIRDQIAGPQKK